QSKPDLRRDDARRVHPEPERLPRRGEQVIASRRLGALLVLGAALALGACASTGTTQAPAPPPAREATPPPPPPRARLAAPHNEQADRLEREGRLREALDERTIALTIDPSDATAQAAVRRLEGLVERGVAQRVEEGRQALSRGSHAEARRRFLAA